MANSIEQAEAALPATAAETATAIEPARTAGTESAVAAPAAEPHAPTPSTADTAAPDGDALIAGAGSVDDFRRLMQGLPPTPKPEEAAPFAGTEEATANPEDLAGLAQGAALPKRLRIASLPEDRQRAIVRLADPNASMEEVLRSLGAPQAAEAVPPAVEAAPVDAGTPAAAPAVSEPPAKLRDIDPAALTPPKETSGTLRTQLAALRKERSTAMRAADMDRAADIDERIGELENRLPDIQAAERNFSSAYSTAWDQSARQAIAAYPDVQVRGSQIAQEMARLDQQLVRTGDSLQHHPDKPMMLAARAAANLGIAPRGAVSAARVATPTAAAPLKPSPQSVPSPRAATSAAVAPAPAAGGARSAAPSPAAATARSEELLGSIKDTSQMHALLNAL